ncbi:LuxR C-terminal-related transcriptional regulator [Streptomyces sp. NPDC101158]|uniref:helix-turn-helix transcriptional regulator n=1 Tax=Streptomyces sp. NPDC101158 TaxID=3366117 RepID=UPI00381CC189
MGHPVLAAFLLPDLVEAAIRAGQRERATAPAALLAQWAQAARRPAALALSHRRQALTGTDDQAEQHFTNALHLHDEGTAQPFERARTELLYGEWLRRERRRTDARNHLRSALETFDELDARPWASRARTELQATGETTDPDSRPDPLLSWLSPQEREVIRLAATGATNRQIASQLFLSPRTVGHHLYRAFPKLGITTRTELPLLLSQTDHPSPYKPERPVVVHDLQGFCALQARNEVGAAGIPGQAGTAHDSGVRRRRRVSTPARDVTPPVFNSPGVGEQAPGLGGVDRAGGAAGRPALPRVDGAPALAEAEGHEGRRLTPRPVCPLLRLGLSPAAAAVGSAGPRGAQAGGGAVPGRAQGETVHSSSSARRSRASVRRVGSAALPRARQREKASRASSR